MNIPIAIVDDHTLFRNGLKAIFDDIDGIEVVLEGQNGHDLLTKLSDIQPEVILMDVEMPVLDGLQTTEQVKLSYPEIKVIILSTHDDDGFILSAIEKGANGYLLKTAEEAEVEMAIKSVLEKGFYFNDRVSKTLLRKVTEDNIIQPFFSTEIQLKETEIQILEMICQELTTTEIADRLCLGKRTIDGYRGALLEKVGARNTAGLVIYAVKNGYF